MENRIASQRETPRASSSEVALGAVATSGLCGLIDLFSVSQIQRVLARGLISRWVPAGPARPPRP